MPIETIPKHYYYKTWYRVPLSRGLCSDGSDYHIYVNHGTNRHLCIFFSGGGVAWNDFTAAHPSTAGRLLMHQPNYYWSNLRPITEWMNVGVGITKLQDKKNPLADWSFIIITYATGDFHIGNSTMDYIDTNGAEQTMHFHGLKNFRQSMAFAGKMFPNPDRLLIAGNSAGAFAVPALTQEICERWYPDCKDVTLLSDSAQLCCDTWPHIVKDVWHAPKPLWQCLSSGNVALDWYRRLQDSCPGRFTWLYASSIRDYLLSAYYNDITHKRFITDPESMDCFFEQLKDMVRALKDLRPDCGIFLNNWTLPPLTQGGTLHTAVREAWFTTARQDHVTMAEWLGNALSGNVTDIGMHLLTDESAYG